MTRYAAYSAIVLAGTFLAISNAICQDSDDPLKQRLDAALDEYNTSIGVAIDELAKNLEDEFEKAQRKGDIQLARTCKEAEKVLREQGIPPQGDFLKNARDEAQRRIRRAIQNLEAEYDTVARQFLKNTDLERAEKVLSEKAELLAEMKAWKDGSRELPKRPSTPRQGNPSVKTTTRKSLEFVLVGNPGNPADETGLGSVDYSFLIGKYEVTVGQYVTFLNAAAKGDPHGLYDDDMSTELGGKQPQVKRSGPPGGYSYTALGRPDLPITCINVLDAARFANWLHNGGGNGSTEHGAYDLQDVIVGDEIALERTPGAKFFVPTENEWYKAAYYDPHKDGKGGYWNYATASDKSPEYKQVCCNFPGTVWRGLLPVSEFRTVASHYGCCGMTGSVEEWTETAGRDWNWNRPPTDKSHKFGISISTHAAYGFRIGAAGDE